MILETMNIKDCYIKLDRIDSNSLQKVVKTKQPLYSTKEKVEKTMPELNIKSRPIRVKIKKEPQDDFYYYYDSVNNKKINKEKEIPNNDPPEFESEDEIVEELQITHSLNLSPTQYICSDCDTSFNSKKYLKKHFLNKLCPNFSHKKLLSNKLINTEFTNDKLENLTDLKCPLCLVQIPSLNVKFGNKESLANHIIIVHKDLVDNLSLENQNDFNNDYVLMNGIKVYLPLQLRLNYLNKFSTEESSILNNNLPYICCGETFANRLLLNKHMKKEHSPNNFTFPAANSLASPLKIENSYQMNGYSKDDMIANEIILTSHNPSVNDISVVTSNNDYMASIIGHETIVNFENINSFDNYEQKPFHTLNTLLPKEAIFYNCNFCDETFKSRTLMKIHVANIHPNDEYNDSSFDEGANDIYRHKRKSNHLSGKHRRLKNENLVHVCEICSRTFLKRSHLNRHMASAVHSDVLVHRCGYCGLRFDSNLALREHLVDFFYHKDPEISRIPKYVCYLCTFPHILGIGSIESAQAAVGDVTLTIQQQLLLQPLLATSSASTTDCHESVKDGQSNFRRFGSNNNNNTSSNTFTLDDKGEDDGLINIGGTEEACVGATSIINKKRRRPPDLMLKLVTELLTNPFPLNPLDTIKPEPIPSIDYIIDEKTGEKVPLNEGKISSRIDGEEDAFNVEKNRFLSSKRHRIIKVTRFRSKEELLRHMYYVHPREYLLSKTTTSNLQKWLDRQHLKQLQHQQQQNSGCLPTSLDNGEENQKAVQDLSLDEGSLLENQKAQQLEIAPTTFIDATDEPPFFLLSHSLQISEEGRHSQMFLHEPRLGIIKDMVNVAFFSKDNLHSEYYRLPGEMPLLNVNGFKSEFNMDDASSILYQQQDQNLTAAMLLNQDESMRRQLSAGSVLLGLNPDNQATTTDMLIGGTGTIEGLLFDDRHQHLSLSGTTSSNLPASLTSTDNHLLTTSSFNNTFDSGPLGGMFNSGPTLNLYKNKSEFPSTEYEDPCGNYQILRISDINSNNPFFTRVRRRTRHDLGDVQGHRCKVCGKILAYDRSLKQHIRAMHPHEWARIERERMRRFSSGFAERRTRFDLRCEPGHLCEFCGKTLAYDRSLKQHIKNVHRTLLLASQGIDVLTTSHCSLSHDGIRKTSEGRTYFQSTLPPHLQEWKIKSEQEEFNAANTLILSGGTNNEEFQLHSSNDLSGLQLQTTSDSSNNFLQTVTRVELDEGTGKFIIVETPMTKSELLDNGIHSDNPHNSTTTTLIIDPNAPGGGVVLGSGGDTTFGTSDTDVNTYIISDNGTISNTTFDTNIGGGPGSGLNSATITYNEYGQPVLNYSSLNDHHQQHMLDAQGHQQTVKRRTRFDLTGPGFLCNFCGKTLAYDRSLKQHIKTMHREEWIKMAKNKMLCKGSNTTGNGSNHVGPGSVTSGLGRRGAAPPLIQSLLWGGSGDTSGGGVEEDLLNNISNSSNNNNDLGGGGNVFESLHHQHHQQNSMNHENNLHHQHHHFYKQEDAEEHVLEYDSSAGAANLIVEGGGTMYHLTTNNDSNFGDGNLSIHVPQVSSSHHHHHQQQLKQQTSTYNGNLVIDMNGGGVSNSIITTTLDNASLLAAAVGSVLPSTNHSLS